MPSILMRVWSVAASFANVLWYFAAGRKFDLVDQRRYWEERSESGVDNWSAVAADAYYQRLDEFVLSSIARYAEPGGRFLLEVGAYQGYRLRKYAATMPDRTFVGIDLGFTNLALGRQRLAHVPNAAVVNADACALPFAAGSADLVYTVVALSHVPHTKIKDALAQMLLIARRHVLIVEIDVRPMRGRRKFGALRLAYGYSHRYEQLVDPSLARLVAITPITDEAGHPRYTAFAFEKSSRD